MNAKNEARNQRRKGSISFSWPSLWLGVWRIAVVGITLAGIYYLFALWGVILLAILAGRQARAVLRWEAQRKR